MPTSQTKSHSEDGREFDVAFFSGSGGEVKKKDLKHPRHISNIFKITEM